MLQNLRVERLWPEINNRLNYPLKAALAELIENDYVDMNNNIHKFCTSNLLLQVSAIGMDRCVAAWNQHYIARQLIVYSVSATENLLLYNINCTHDMYSVHIFTFR